MHTYSCIPTQPHILIHACMNTSTSSPISTNTCNFSVMVEFETLQIHDKVFKLTLYSILCLNFTTVWIQGSCSNVRAPQMRTYSVAI